MNTFFVLSGIFIVAFCLVWYWENLSKRQKKRAQAKAETKRLKAEIDRLLELDESENFY